MKGKVEVVGGRSNTWTKNNNKQILRLRVNTGWRRKFSYLADPKRHLVGVG